MDINDLRVVMTVVSFLVFIGIIVWAFRATNKRRFDEAERLPFDEPAAATPGRDNDRLSGGGR